MRVECLEDGQFFCGLLAKPIPPVLRVVSDVVYLKVIVRSALRCGDQILFPDRKVVAERKWIIVDWIVQHSPGTSGGPVRSQRSSTEHWGDMDIADLLDYPYARFSIAVLLHHVWTQVLLNCR